jgi:hypothetical protein
MDHKGIWEKGNEGMKENRKGRKRVRDEDTKEIINGLLTLVFCTSYTLFKTMQKLITIHVTSSPFSYERLYIKFLTLSP